MEQQGKRRHGQHDDCGGERGIKRINGIGKNTIKHKKKKIKTSIKVRKK